MTKNCGKIKSAYREIIKNAGNRKVVGTLCGMHKGRHHHYTSNFSVAATYIIHHLAIIVKYILAMLLRFLR